MTLPAYVLRGVRSFAKLSLSRLFKGGNETYPPYTHAGVPVDGTSGTLAGIAEPGALLIDTTNKTLYQNSNTKASPTWVNFTTASGSGAFTGTFDGVVGGVTPAAATATNLITTTAKLDTGTKTATASGGAATLNKSAGKITSESLTTAAGASYVLTLTNSAIAAADQVFASVANGTNAQGIPVVSRVTPGSNSVTIAVTNLHASQALNGTIVISFAVLKN